MRLAIGFSPTGGELDRPTTIFVETTAGVLIKQRAEVAPRLVNGVIDLPPLTGRAETVEPGSALYFDAVVDAFSSSCIVRSVTEIGPDVLLSMLATEQGWDALPRPRVLA